MVLWVCIGVPAGTSNEFWGGVVVIDSSEQEEVEKFGALAGSAGLVTLVWANEKGGLGLAQLRLLPAMAPALANK